MRRWLLVATLVAGARPLAPPRIAPPTLGVDYGLRRVGVCVGVGFASRPLEVIEHDEDIDAVVARLLQIARRERIASIVVGLPLEKDGAEGLQCAATRRFADALAAAAPAMPLVLWDERFSSREAEALLAHRPGAALDAVAAGNAYRRLRHLQHGLRLNDAPKARVPKDEVVAERTAIRAVWSRLFDDASNSGDVERL